MPIGYIPIAGTATGTRQWEHTQGRNGFWHDGKYWAFLPIGATWELHYRSGALPAAGATGGWTATGITSAKGGRITSYQQGDVVYMIGLSTGASRPDIEKFEYNSGLGTWSRTFNQSIRPSSGTYGFGTAKTSFGNNDSLQFHIDQNGNVILICMGPGSTTAGGEDGLLVGCPDDMAFPEREWSKAVIDGTTGGGTYNDLIANSFSFTQDGVDKVGIVYSNDTYDEWYFTAINTPTTANIGNYLVGANWSTPVQISTTIPSIDDHLSLQSVLIAGVWYIVAALKDRDNSIWYLVGTVGTSSITWTETLVYDGVPIPNGSPSRPCCVVDGSNAEAHIFYQQSASATYGDTYTKVIDIVSPSVADTDDYGTLFLENGTDGFLDPTGPVHPITSGDGGFYVFAQNNGNATWYNYVEVASAGGHTTTVAASLAAVAAALASTHTPPEFNASAAPSLAAVDAVLVGAHLPPEFIATLAASLAPVTAALASTHTPPEFATSIGAALQAVVASAEATHLPPGVIATLAASLAAVSADATASHLPPEFDGAIGAALAAVTADLTATHIAPGLTTTIAATLVAVEAAAAGTFVLPERSGIIAATLAAVEASLEATSSPPPLGSQIALTLAAVEAAVFVNLGIVLPAEHRQVLLDAVNRTVLLDGVKRDLLI